MSIVLRAIAAALAAAAALAPPAHAATYAPLDAPGPKLTPSRLDLAASVTCHGDLRGAEVEPVLLLPATTVDSEENFASGLEKSLSVTGVPWCTPDQPDDRQNMDDIQQRGEYVTYAMRHVAKLAGRPIAVAGHSQGGMVMRWSLRFWPDTRRLVADVIGIAGSNHGSTTVAAQCAAGCSPAFAQQRAGSVFEDALNSYQETFAGIAYTEISSNNDEIVTPGGTNGASSVTGPGDILNVAVQEICPGDVREHLALHVDPVTWALLHDAITHDGPADLKRIPASVCAENYPPGVDEATLPTDLAATYGVVATQIATYPHGLEPPLKCYVTASCVQPPQPCVEPRQAKIRVPGHAAIRRVRVRVAGRALSAARSGRTLRLHLADYRGKTIRVRLAVILAGGHVEHFARSFSICA